MEDPTSKSSWVEFKSMIESKDRNVLELDYRVQMAKGCVFGSHRRGKSFVKLYIVPCNNTLQIQNFKNIYDLKPKQHLNSNPHKNYY